MTQQQQLGCALDPSRPCDSKSRAKGRYTRQEIEKVAKRCGIKDVQKKTITQLCEEVRKFIQDRATQQPLGKPCPPNTEKAWRPNYECNPKTGRWIKRKGAPAYYFRYELQKLDEAQLRRIAQNLGIEVEEGEDESSIIHEILERQYPLVQDPTRAKNLYVKKFKDALLKIYRRRIVKAIPKMIRMRVYDAGIKPQGVVRLLTQKTPIPYAMYEADFTGLSEVMYRRQYVGTDVDGLERNQEWFAMQRAYQMTLPFLKQLMILSYTHGGDAMIHAYLDNGFSIQRSFVNDKYRASYVYPLYPVLVYLLTSVSAPRQKEWIDTLQSMCIPSKCTSKDVRDLIEKCGGFDNTYSPQRPPRRGDPLFKNYKEVVDVLFRKRSMKSELYDALMKEYVGLLKQIIHDAPPLFHHLVVYKGVKSVAYMDFTEKNMYTNKRFISTTFKSSIATGSTFTNPKCCVQKITLLQGTECLYPIWTYYTEYEILLPPNRKMYASSSLYVPKEGSKKQTMNLVITN